MRATPPSAAESQAVPREQAHGARAMPPHRARALARRGGTRCAALPHMTPKKSSYDDLVREVVPLPDSSHRPLRAEEAEAESRRPGPHFTTAFPDDQSPSAANLRPVLDALAGADLSDLTVALDGGRVTVEGSVATDEDRDRIVRALGDAPGVITVIDTLRIRT